MDRRNEGAKKARGARNFIWIQIVSHSRRLSGTTGAPVAPSASRSGNPKEMVLSLYALTGLRVQGGGVCGRYVPEDHDAKLVEPPFALGCPKVWFWEVGGGDSVRISKRPQIRHWGEECFVL